MNHGVVEQFGVPQTLYDWPATMFVARFPSAPPPRELPALRGMVGHGTTTVTLGDAAIEVPAQRDGAHGALVLGVRPELWHSTTARPTGAG